MHPSKAPSLSRDLTFIWHLQHLKNFTRFWIPDVYSNWMFSAAPTKYPNNDVHCSFTSSDLFCHITLSDCFKVFWWCVLTHFDHNGGGYYGQAKKVGDPKKWDWALNFFFKFFIWIFTVVKSWVSKRMELRPVTIWVWRMGL